MRFRLTLTDDPSILVVAAVVDPQLRVVALRQGQLVSEAVHLVVEDGLVLFPEAQLCVGQVQQGSDET